MPVKVVCKHCGDAFESKPSEAAWRKYCSRACKSAHNSVDLICCVCGIGFRRLKSQLQSGYGKYCSYSCKDTARRKPKAPKVVRTPVFKVCCACGIVFRIPPSRSATARFCSQKCKGGDEAFRAKCSDAQSGEKSWRWSGGRYKRGTGYVRVKSKKLGVERTSVEHREVIVKWMMEECPDHPFLIVVDGVSTLHPDVDVHHIDRVRSNNTRPNLLAVTKSAHARIHHHGKQPEPWECWPQNPKRW